MPLSSSSIIWYVPKSGDARWMGRLRSGISAGAPVTRPRLRKTKRNGQSLTDYGHWIKLHHFPIPPRLPFGRICFVVLVMRKGGESLAFRLYIGSFSCAQLPGPVHTVRLGGVCFLIFSLGLYFVFICIALICLCVPILLCFPGQLSHRPYSFWRWRN